MPRLDPNKWNSSAQKNWLRQKKKLVNKSVRGSSHGTYVSPRSSLQRPLTTLRGFPLGKQQVDFLTMTKDEFITIMNGMTVPPPGI